MTPCPRRTEKLFCCFSAPAASTALIFVPAHKKHELIANSKVSILEVPHFVPPTFPRAPGADKSRGACSGEKTRTRFQRTHLRNAHVCPYGFPPCHEPMPYTKAGEGIPKIAVLRGGYVHIYCCSIFFSSSIKVFTSLNSRYTDANLT